MAQIRRAGHNAQRTRGGDSLSDEVIETLAAEAEAGYDLTKAQWTRAARPSLDEGSSPCVSFRAGRTLYEAARARAEREGRTVSDLAREAMERYIRGSTG